MFIEELTPFWWGVYRFVILAAFVTLPLAVIGVRTIAKDLRSMCEAES